MDLSTFYHRSPAMELTPCRGKHLDTYYGNSETSLFKLLAAVVYETSPEGLVVM